MKKIKTKKTKRNNIKIITIKLVSKTILPIMNTTLYDLFYITGVITLGIGIASLLSTFFILEPMKSYWRTLNDAANEAANAYEMKYYDEYDALLDEMADKGDGGDLSPDELKALYKKTTKDTLPSNGDIIMCYDAVTESFGYYCKTGIVPYKYLETVCRKYCVEHRCLELYVDIRDEYKKAVDKIQKRMFPDSNDNNNTTDTATTVSDTATTATDNKDTSASGVAANTVFVKFKSYNRSGTALNSKMSKADAQAEAERLLKSDEGAMHILRERANRYSYRGKIEDFDTHHPSYLAGLRMNDEEKRRKAAEEESAAEAAKAMSWTEYKKRMTLLSQQ